MLPQEIIRKKRDGEKLSESEIKAFIKGVTDDSVTEGQVAAFCMAVLFNKMEMDERVALTTAMAGSGEVLDWSGEDLGGPILDKHSTGGIGDKVSLILAPVIAACGGFVPMISGRGLGHTGGTLDKMDSIPGYQSMPDNALFRKAVREAGCAIIGATGDLAPADKRIYSIRDVTATVESLDLITASILSKKMAAGLDGLVMDVKFGTGAFMRDYDDAKALADSIVQVANGGGLPTVALLTDMNQTLGRTAGNAVEVLESVEFLRGENRNPRLYEVNAALCAELLVLGKLAQDTDIARGMVDAVLENGQAAEHFAKMVTVLGGPADFMDKPEKYLKAAPVIREFFPEETGTLSAVDARKIGLAIVGIGGGRTRPQDGIDHSVGLTEIAQIGDIVGKNNKPLAIIHAQSEENWQKTAAALADAVTVATAGDAADAVIVREKIAA
ncbi:MAG: thymidine phosphorylase [Pseudomonadota bacterium]|nr:thymidine phosphorylase [Pseudomonadota bacterium]QKK06268.1 MAG: thymidine phosphorylase [Pseudomonadota bacterium]